MDESESVAAPVNADATIISRSGNTNATGGSATIGDIHVHVPQTPVPAAPPQPPEIKKKVIHLRHLDPVLKLVSLQDYGFRLMGKPCARAILLPIYFDPVQSDQGTFMANTRAHLLFKNKSTGNEIQVARACWIGPTTHDYIDMSMGEDRLLMLVLLDEDKKTGTLFSNNLTDSTWYARSDKEEPFALRIIELEPYDVTVVVSWSGGKEIFELHLDLAALSQLLPA